jgi:hypothetical protein
VIFQQSLRKVPNPENNVTSGKSTFPKRGRIFSERGGGRGSRIPLGNFLSSGYFSCLSCNHIWQDGKEDDLTPDFDGNSIRICPECQSANIRLNPPT